jgi:hypothetical protein
MHKPPPRHRRLLLDKEIIKILTAADRVAGALRRTPYTPSMPPENCANTSQVAHDC